MIHTLSLNIQLPYDEWEAVKAQYKPCITYRKDPKTERQYTEIRKYEKQGIVYDFRKYKSKGCSTQYLIYLRLNPSKLLGGGTLSIFSPDHAEELLTAYHDTVSDLWGESWPEFASLLTFCVRRVDYCIQLDIDPDIGVETYIRLFQHGDKPHRGKYSIQYDYNQDPIHEAYKRHKDGSVYFKGGALDIQDGKARYTRGSMIVNIYDKREEMEADNDAYQKKHGRPKYAAEVLTEAANKLRVEIQALPRKVDNLKRANTMTTKSILEYCDIDIAREIVLRMYAQICGIGDYMDKDRAKQMIANSSKQTKTKERMITALDIISPPNGGRPKEGWAIWKIREDMETNQQQYPMSRTQFDNVLKALASIGVNPVLVPSKSATIPSLYPRLQAYFDDLQSVVCADIEHDSNMFDDNEG